MTEDRTTVSSSDTGRAAPPRILELRVHGVHNTQPHELLDLPKDEVRLAAGDALGSFWEPTPVSLAARTVARGAPVDDRGELPPDVHREAYSWGGMVRTTPPESGLGGKILAALARAGWALLLPFSLANAGMWTWQLPSGGRPRWSARAAVLRVFGALLTLLMSGTAAIVALDVVAMQCYGDGVLRCTALPGPFAAMAEWPLGARLAVLSIAPVLVILGLWWLSAVSRLRYDVADRIVGPRTPGAPHPEPDGASQLARRAFWLRDGATARLACTHVAATGALTALLLFTTWSGPLEFAGAIGFWGSLALLLLALGTAAATRTMPFERPAPVEDAPRPRWHVVLLAVCLAAWIGAATTVAFTTTDCPRAPETDVIAAPSSCWTGAAPLFGVDFGISAAVVLAILVAELVLIAVMAVFRVRREPATPGQSQRRYRAWNGRGPAVFSSCSLALGLIWSSLIAVGVGDWLNGAASPSSLATEADAPVVAVDGELLSVDLDLPSIFSTFGLVALALLLVGVVVLGVPVALPRRLDERMAANRAEASLAAPAGPAPEVPSPAGRPSGVPTPSREGIPVGGSPGLDPQRPAGSSAEYAAFLARPILRARAHAARIHLVEVVAGALAIGSALALVATVAAPWLGAAIAATISPLLDLTLVAWALIAVAVVGALVLGGDRGARPFGIVWDVTCFLPRTGHPLGPPCFVERAAPEIASRILWWFDESEQAGNRDEREVVLVAHSMGAVVATCALSILSLHPRAEEVRARLSYLTFGVQLRPWFGRFFPEVLGPDTLGTTPCSRPRVFRTRDPWEADFLHPAPASGDPVDAAGFRLPIRRWISLWRGTDLLGFPAYSNSPVDNPVDRFTEEFDTTGYFAMVATHGEYFRTATYQTAFAELTRERPGDGVGDADRPAAGAPATG